MKKVTWNMLLLFTLLIVLLSCNIVSGAFINLGHTARQRALANASSALFDEGAVFSNPSGLTKLRGMAFSASYSSLHLGLTDNSQISDGVLILGKSFSSGGAGLGYSRRTLGSLYQESTLTLGYGINLLDRISAGINLSEITIGYGISEYSEDNPYFTEHGRLKSCFTYDFGLLLDLSEQFTFAASLKKINQPDIGLGREALIPAELTVGGRYQGSRTTFLFEGSRSSYRNTASIGVEQVMSDESFVIRGGFVYGDYSLSAFTAGFGLKTGLLSIDYSYRYSLSGLTDFGSHLVTVKFRSGIVKK
jgi:hypothetical protein